MKIKAKILSGFIAVLVILLIVASTLSTSLNIIKKESSNMDHQILRYEQLSNIQYNFVTQAADIRGYLHYKQDSFIEGIKTHIEKNNKIIDELIDTANLKSDKEKYIELKNIQKKYEGMLLDKIAALAKKGQDEKASQVAVEEGVPLTNAFDKLINELKQDRNTRMEESSHETMSTVDKVFNITIIATIVSILLGLIISFILAQLISRPIKLVAENAERIASGDLTGDEIKVKTKDEIAQLAKAFNTMRMYLKDISYQLQEKSELVASSSTELSVSAENVSAGATETANNVNELAATVEELNANASSMADSSKHAGKYANEGNDGIQRIFTQMESIHESTETSWKVTKGLNESAEKISNIVEMITQIADQTNLLALNAAIEAARAGEHGSGFAVVADEVRKLAEQSSNAAQDIQNLILGIQQESEMAVNSMSDSSTKVNEGSQVVREVGQIFEKIIESVNNLTEDIMSLSTASEQITSSVQNVAAASEEQTAAMEEVSSTTQSLTQMADDLEQISKKFKVK